jgi:hypothetical protein
MVFAQSTASNTQIPNMLFQKWKLAEVYDIDSLQLEYNKHDISAAEHRAHYQFTLQEIKVEQQILQFTPNELAYSLEIRMDFDNRNHQLGRFTLKNQVLFFEKENSSAKILELKPNFLILGKNKTRIEVYTPQSEEIDDLKLPDDYIWQYYKIYFPNQFKRLEEG